VVLASTALGLAACGGHGGFTTATRRSARPAEPSPAETAAARRAFARAVNLTQADVPGFRLAPESREKETPAEQRLQQRFVACVGGAESTGGSQEQSSGLFRHQQGLVDVSVSSSVGFLRPGSSAAAEVALLRDRRTGRCLASYLDARYRGKRFGAAIVGRIKVQQGVPPAPGTSGGFGWRIAAPLQLRGLSVPFYLDVLGFVYRGAEVRLVSSALIVPFPAKAEETLYRLLLARAVSHRR
jgi:hypothetical protein